ncbi:MAG: hypothetical protein IJT03_07995 [Clostridia bacterium]|nr:hypothetical protein [Clostridia bacterium]
MKDSFIPETPDNDEAQTVDTSGLLSLRGETDDLQPLEEVDEPGYVDLNINDLSQSQSRNEQHRGKEKRLSSRLKLNINAKTVVLIASILFVCAALGVGAGFLFNHLDRNTDRVKCIYSSDGASVVMLWNKKTYPLGKTGKITVTDDGRYIYFIRKSGAENGHGELRCIDTGSKSSLRKEGSFVDNNVIDFYTLGDNDYVSYKKSLSGAVSCHMYSAQKGQSRLISSDADELFCTHDGSFAYFTVKNSGGLSLYRTNYGEKPRLIAEKLNAVVANYRDEERVRIVYTVGSKTAGKSDAYLIRENEEPVNICTSADDIRLEDFAEADNLYYLVADDNNVGWQDFVEDSLYDEDITVKKPVKGDYLVEKGFIFKRQVLDETAYNRDVAKYEAKLERDEIRTALNGIDLGVSAGKVYSCYAFDGSMTHKLAAGLSAGGVLKTAQYDEPRIVFRKSSINVNNKISIETLVSIARNSTVQKAVDYVTENVIDSYSVNDGFRYAWIDSGKTLEYTIEDYTSESTEFIFGGRDSLYAKVGDRYFYSPVSVSEIGERERIASDAYAGEYDGGYFYYFLDDDSSKGGTLCRFSPKTDSVRISDNAGSYLADGDRVIVFTSESMGIRLFDGTVSSEISKSTTGVFRRSGASFAYCTGAEKDMYLVKGTAAPEKITDKVDDIYYISD